MTRAAERIVVVGGGIAGLRTAEALRDRGFTGELLGVSAERHLPYARPPLSKAALTGPDWASTPLDSAAAVRWRLGVTATGLDLTGGYVELDDGTRVAFDGVVLATGLRARRLPAANTGLALRTVDDADRLRAALRCGPGQLVIVGAGFIGSEVAAAARSLDWSVTIVDAGPTPLAAALGPGPARWLWEQHRVRGVRTRFGYPVVAVERVGARQHVVLGDRSVLMADAVVTGLGAAPNIEWLQGCGLDIADGVLTDARRQALTAGGAVAEGVVAVGDIARTPSPLTGGRPVRHEHWTAATIDAHRAAAALTGLESPLEVPPVFWTDVYEHRVQVVGLPEGAESEPEAGPRGFCVCYRSTSGALTGAVAVNWPQRLPALTREIGESGAAA